MRVLHGDCLALLPTLDADSVHACVTDPPYGLEFMGKDWDGSDGFRRSLNAADAGRDSVFGRTSQRAPEYRTTGWQSGAGFSKPGIGERKTEWPSFTSGNDQFGGANPTCATCGGRARGKKKCACAEPNWKVKGAAPDPMYGRARQMQTYQTWCEGWAREVFRVLKPGAHLLAFGGTRTYHRMVCAIEDAGFEIRDTTGWLYGAGFPKSFDVSKAIDKTLGAEREVIASVRVKSGGTEHINRKNADTHAYRPDGYQKGENVLDVTAPATPEAAQWHGWGTALKPAMELIVVARKPLIGTVAANVLAHGTGGINIDACRIPTDDSLGGGDLLVKTKVKPDGWDRPWMHDHAAKKSHAERVAGNVAKAEALGRWPANLVHDGSDEVLAAFPDAPGQQRYTGPEFGNKDSVNCYGDYGPIKAAAPRNDSGSAARFFYSAKATAKDRAGSRHPTVKPLALMTWLVRLITPPGGMVLDPFAGTGTTLLTADRLGFDAIGIEQSAEYVADIHRRLASDAPLLTAVDHVPQPPEDARIADLFHEPTYGD